MIQLIGACGQHLTGLMLSEDKIYIIKPDLWEFRFFFGSRYTLTVNTIANTYCSWVMLSPMLQLFSLSVFVQISSFHQWWFSCTVIFYDSFHVPMFFFSVKLKCLFSLRYIIVSVPRFCFAGVKALLLNWKKSTKTYFACFEKLVAWPWMYDQNMHGWTVDKIMSKMCLRAICQGTCWDTKQHFMVSQMFLCVFLFSIDSHSMWTYSEEKRSFWFS